MEITEHPYPVGDGTLIEPGDRVRVRASAWSCEATFLGWNDRDAPVIDEGDGPEEMSPDYVIERV